MALTLLLLVPAVAGAWLLAAGRRMATGPARLAALGAASVTGVTAVVAVATRPAVDHPWIPGLDVGWRLRIDGLSAPLVLLTALVGVVVTVHALTHVPHGGSPGLFLGSILVVETGALATFLAGDAILFFLAFEVVLVPMWALITKFGDPHDAARRGDAGGRFVLFTALGSTLMLLGILLVVGTTGTADLARLPGLVAGLDHRTQVLAAALLTAGLAVKVPLWPVHTWLPPAHTTAPTAGSVLLAAILLKMGTYGLVRLPVATVGDGFGPIAPVVAVLGAVGIVWGGLVCLVERDLKRLIAYSSIAHMGFVALGIGSGTAVGLQAALYANVAHGLISALLFLVVGGLKERWGDVDLATVRPALREVSPRLGLALVLGLAATLGLPGLAGFWGEFLAILGSWQGAAAHGTALLRWTAAAGAVGAVLATAYALRVARIVWVGPAVPPAVRAAGADTDLAESTAMSALSVGIVLLGVLPGPLLALTWPAVEAVTTR